MGMGFVEAQATIKEMGLTLGPAREGVLTQYKITSNDERNLSFCRQKLVSYSKNYMSHDVFVAEMAALTGNLGAGMSINRSFEAFIPGMGIYTKDKLWVKSGEMLVFRTEKSAGRYYYSARWYAKEECIQKDASTKQDSASKKDSD